MIPTYNRLVEIMVGVIIVKRAQYRHFSLFFAVIFAGANGLNIPKSRHRHLEGSVWAVLHIYQVVQPACNLAESKTG